MNLAPWPRKNPHLTKGQRRAQSYAIPDHDLDRLCQDLITVIASVPEGERIGYYRGLERYSAHRRPIGHYDMAKVAVLAMRLANVCWDSWPPQTDETGETTTGPLDTA